jgi:hypothetical protein
VRAPRVHNYDPSRIIRAAVMDRRLSDFAT